MLEVYLTLQAVYRASSNNPVRILPTDSSISMEMDEVPLSIYTPVDKGPSIPDDYLTQFLPASLKDQIRTSLSKEQVHSIDKRKKELQDEILRVIVEKIGVLYDYSNKMMLEHTLGLTKKDKPSGNTTINDTPVVGFDVRDPTKSVESSENLGDFNSEETSAGIDTVSEGGSAISTGSQSPALKSSLVRRPRGSSSSTIEDRPPRPKKQVSFNLEADVTYFSSDDEPDLVNSSGTDEDEIQGQPLLGPLDDEQPSVEQVEDVYDDSEIQEGITASPDEMTESDIENMSTVSTEDENKATGEDPDEDPDASNVSTRSEASAEDLSSPPLESSRINIHSDDEDEDDIDDGTALFEFDESLDTDDNKSTGKTNGQKSILFNTKPLPSQSMNIDDLLASSLKMTVLDPALSMSLPLNNHLSDSVNSHSTFRRKRKGKYVSESSPTEESESDSDSQGNPEMAPINSRKQTDDENDSALVGSVPIDISIPGRRSSFPQSMLEPADINDPHSVLEVDSRYGEVVRDPEMISSPKHLDQYHQSLTDYLLSDTRPSHSESR